MKNWNNIPENRVSQDSFMAVIEISKGCKVKYELDEEIGMLRMDRILYTSTHYPANYGFIPLTHALDGDHLDVLVLCSESINPMTLVSCYPIGVIFMEDSGYSDEKIIAIPYGDPTYNSYKSIEELPSHIFSEMIHFFSVYKSLEGKETALESVKGVAEAKEIIQSCIERYREKFAN